MVQEMMRNAVLGLLAVVLVDEIVTALSLTGFAATILPIVVGIAAVLATLEPVLRSRFFGGQRGY